MNQQLRELLTRIPASPERDELQEYLELYDKAFEATKSSLIDAEALITELEAGKPKPSRSGQPVTAKQTINNYIELAPRIVPILLHHLTSNGFFKLDQEKISDFTTSGRAIIAQEKADGLHLYLADAEDQKQIRASDDQVYQDLG